MPCICSPEERERLSVLTAAGVKRQSLNAPFDGIEVRVTSMQDKSDRYHARAHRHVGK